VCPSQRGRRGATSLNDQTCGRSALLLRRAGEPTRSVRGRSASTGEDSERPAASPQVSVREGVSVAIFSDEERQRISAALNSKGINRPCPACGHWEIALVDGYVTHPLFRSATSIADAPRAPEQELTCIAIACGHCGLLSHHTMRGLGLS